MWGGGIKRVDIHIVEYTPCLLMIREAILLAQSLQDTMSPNSIPVPLITITLL